MSLSTLRYVSLALFVSTFGLMSASPTLAGSIPLAHGTADSSQAGFPVLNDTYDGNLATGWGVGSSGFSDHTAVWEAVPDIAIGPGTTGFTFKMFQDAFANHAIGKFRLSVTTDPRSTFADDLQNGGDVTATWTQLDPISVTDTGGATFSLDHTTHIVLVSGTNPNFNDYTIVATTTLTGTVTGFRLETLQDASFNRNGPGRSSNGNFVLSEFQVSVPEPASLGLLVMVSGTILVRRRSRIA